MYAGVLVSLVSGLAFALTFIWFLFGFVWLTVQCCNTWLMIYMNSFNARERRMYFFVIRMVFLAPLHVMVILFTNHIPDSIVLLVESSNGWQNALRYLNTARLYEDTVYYISILSSLFNDLVYKTGRKIRTFMLWILLNAALNISILQLETVERLLALLLFKWFFFLVLFCLLIRSCVTRKWLQQIVWE